MAEALSSIYRLEGGRGLMTGLGATLARDVPFSAVYYAVYTQLKQLQPGVSSINQNEGKSILLFFLFCLFTILFFFFNSVFRFVSRPWARASVVDLWRASSPPWLLIRPTSSRLLCSFSRHAISTAHGKLSSLFTAAWELKVSFPV